MYALGVDLGGTRIKSGVVDADGVVHAFGSVATPGHPDDIVEAVAQSVARLRGDYEVSQVGVAVAAFLDPTRAHIELSPNIDWADRPLRQELGDRLGLPVVLENDANAAGYAEAIRGAGQGAHPVVMLTLGTGVGGAVVVDSRPLVGARGVAGELGHVIVEPGGVQCGCGQQGSLETVSSGTAISAHVSTLTGTAVTDATQLEQVLASDRSVREAVLARVARGLIQGMVQIQAVVDPEVLVLGGGVTEKLGDVLMEAVHVAQSELLVGRRSRAFPEIRLAQLGNEAGVLGAALLAADQAPVAPQ
ncbi:MAG: Glucokinase [Cellulomonadaceae bacterium TMED98]|nr:MAG: Glucokinase [Cellulomonadaceae bacterium TMED98]